jgi:hypothetical protein
MRLKLIIGIFCFLISKSYAQQTIPVSGGNISGTGGNGVFTVGQMNYGIIIDKNNVSVVKGILQPIEINQATSVDPSFDMAVKCSLSPNPASDFIFLKIDDTNFNDYSFELIDLNGKALINNPISENITQIDIREFISANYLIKIMHHNKLITTFKIFKN